MDRHIFETPHNSTLVNQSLFQRVFGWMFAGLLMTGVVAYMLSKNPNVVEQLTNSNWLWGILIAQLVIVLALSAGLNKLPVFLAQLFFFLYAALTGVTMTLLLSYYSMGTIYTAFFTTAGLFGLFAVYGFVTKKDLSKIGSIAMMLFLGLVLASIVNIFIGNSFFELLLSYGLIALICIITAWDIQNIKAMARDAVDEDAASRIAIYGALMLYLNFILIFRNLLYILGYDD